MSRSGPLRAWQSQNLSPGAKTGGATLTANEYKKRRTKKRYKSIWQSFSTNNTDMEDVYEDV